MTSLMHSHTNITNYDNPLETVDMLLSCICTLACVIGSTGNIISLIYFISNRTDLPTCINVYTVIAINDICVTGVCSYDYKDNKTVISNKNHKRENSDGVSRWKHVVSHFENHTPCSPASWRIYIL